MRNDIARQSNDKPAHQLKIAVEFHTVFKQICAQRAPEVRPTVQIVADVKQIESLTLRFANANTHMSRVELECAVNCRGPIGRDRLCNQHVLLWTQRI